MFVLITNLLHSFSKQNSLILLKWVQILFFNFTLKNKNNFYITLFLLLLKYIQTITRLYIKSILKTNNTYDNSTFLFSFTLTFLYSIFHLLNSAGPQVGGSVKHSGEPWQSHLGQSSCNPKCLPQTQPTYNVPPRNSRDLERICRFNMFCVDIVTVKVMSLQWLIYVTNMTNLYTV